MSSIKLAPNASGTGIFTVASPNSNTNRTLNLPDQSGDFITTDSSGAAVLPRVNSSNEGGQINFNRAVDNVANWSIDSFGNDTTPTLRFIDNGNVRTVIDGSGNVGIGTSSPSSRLDLAGGVLTTRGGEIRANNTGSAATLTLTGGNSFAGGSGAGIAIRGYTVGYNNGGMEFYYGNGTTTVEAARIDSSGYFKASNTGTYTYTATTNEFRQSASSEVLVLTNSNASPNGQQIYHVTDANNTSNTFLFCYAGATTRATIRSNGGIANFQANNVNLSDRREKTNFAPAGEYLSKICAIPVQTFNYIDQNMEDDPGLTLGVVAQDVQAVAPELVMESNWGTEEEPKMRLSIYQTDLQYALMKCIQEQQAMIQTLTARIEALEAK